MIRIENLIKTFDQQPILKNVSLTIEKGDVYAILGVSGAGKSTLLRCINGLERFDQGKLFINQQESAKLSEKEWRILRKKIGMIFQGNSLMEQLTVFQNVALPMTCSGYSKEAIAAKVNQLLKEVGILDKADMKPKQLSGGQKQRAAIARALTLDPEILLCDEATSALDPSITNEIVDLLRRLNQKYQLTIVIVTHQVEVVKRICNKVAVLSNGEIADQGEVKQIFLDHSPILATIVGENHQPITVKSGHFMLKIVADLQKIDVLQAIHQQGIQNYQILYTQTERFRDEEIAVLTLILPASEQSNVQKLNDTSMIQYQIGGVHE
ncbi:methionine ABC transporter ATP-binding protein [Candidatus Enterococcus ferrettii]|uniref:D-methionine transport system ATP-binding protein n=1 Tax=Candidatus Enterococcus ferrettii TaxID=2815324 RepID=A0ABV0ETJ8_9ENTE|nr:ATP-binding cassette domain-containing protein [Enterococcus sp. 665A]MBO1342215.1 ATP-binding cassette domain-containing protein [Enterococcus sp. 665A]